MRLLGTGMPSYWSVSLDGHRFDLGLSGWTQNDWSRSARFEWKSVRPSDCLPKMPKKPSTWFSQEALVGV